MTLIEILKGIIADKTGGSITPTAPNGNDEPRAARTPEERTTACAELERLEHEGETVGVKLRREHERATGQREAAERALAEARKAESHARSAYDLHSWGVDVRRSRISAMLRRGAAPIIDQVADELARQWEAARFAGRHIGAMNAPLTATEIADNAAADANLAGLMAAQRECEALKLRALSDDDLARELERIVAAIASRHPRYEPPAAIEVNATARARTRLAHSARAVA